MAEEQVPVLKEFFAGDTDTTEDYTVERSRTAVNLTGYDPPKLYARNQSTQPGTNVPAITGSIPNPSAGTIRFDHDTIAATAGDYLCDVEIIHPTNGKRTIRRRFRILVTARVHDLTT